MSVVPNLLKATIKDLQWALAEKECTSVDLIEAYLAAIEKDNYQGLKLRAVIETGPREQLVEIARGLDEQRKAGKLMGPLHGIPLLIKDNINTDPELGLKTTAGSFALVDAVVKEDATLIKRLRENGAIVLGKANLSEWANYRQGENFLEGYGHLNNGWSARGGACRSAYNPKRDPGGSSTGSAVGVSAGFAPASIGTETCGSIGNPASGQGLFSIKPTVGLVSMAGVLPLCFSRDVAGPMTKCAYDAALLLSVIAGPDVKDPNTKRWPFEQNTVDFVKQTINPSLNGKRLGFYAFRPELIATEAETDYKKKLMAEAIEKLRVHGATVFGEVEEIDFDVEGFRALDNMAELTEFKEDIAVYFASLAKTPMRTLEDVIKFNIEHKDIEMPPEQPGQERFLQAQATKGRGDPEYIKANEDMIRIADQEGLRVVFDKYDLDGLVFFQQDDIGMPVWFASPARYPIVTVPLGYDEAISEPVTMSIVGRPWSEGKLIEMMAAWEAIFPPRRLPPALEHPETFNKGGS
ncbi:hypothetical protein FFLO_03877 [Filobasidium floriforme]|uniref:Amidase domain-containing protein n=1 Tax=Filobasidium floriforme TaxID=5210 RepID=A0A8K0NSR4_9TREE|nr:amidase signature enzyme [Filobasidium floriforme]KAG7532069.1 hypothetical protein FFLO_03877 [Filobasidium floriforme]KAH8078599.1 amidase signature enzyme [Filobasidium floriforme]